MTNNQKIGWKNWVKLFVLILTGLPMFAVWVLADGIDLLARLFGILSRRYTRVGLFKVVETVLDRCAVPLYNFINYVANNFWPKD